MKKLLISFGIVVALIVWIALGLFGWINGAYNGFVSTGQRTDSQWAQVENVYQRRIDLIPNLVEATKGIFEQEREVFGAIAEARTHYAGTQPNTPEKVEATNQLESALARLMVIIENYPQLRSSEVVSNLMFEMAGTENRITVERQRYNEVVQVYNIQTKTFIGRFIATFFGFKEKPYFKAITIGAEVAPKVNLSLKGATT